MMANKDYYYDDTLTVSLGLSLMTVRRYAVFTTDRPTEVKLGIFIISFYSISEQTMVGNRCLSRDHYCYHQSVMVVMKAAQF